MNLSAENIYKTLKDKDLVTIVKSKWRYEEKTEDYRIWRNKWVIVGTVCYFRSENMPICLGNCKPLQNGKILIGYWFGQVSQY